MKVKSYQLAALCFVAMACLGRADLTAKLTPVEASRFVYEPFTLQLAVNSKADMPNVSTGAGYTVTGVFQKPDSDYFFIELIAEEPGTLTIPPISVKSGEQTVETELLRVSVDAPRRAEEMELFLDFSSTNLVVDLPLKLTVTWKSKVPFTRCQDLQFKLPLLNNPAWDIYPLDSGVPEEKRIGLPVNTQRIIARNETTDTGYELSFSFRMVPRHEGSWRMDANLSCALLDQKKTDPYPSYFNNHFFSTPDSRDHFERIYLSQPGPKLTVQALPDEGRTVRYSGIVEDVIPSASIEPVDTVVGQPMLMTVTLDGLSFSGHIQNLPEATLDGIGSEFQLTHKPMRKDATDTSKSFTYIVRPLRSGLDTVPALTFDIFDPEQNTYRAVRTKPLTIRVEPDGDKTVYSPHVRTDQQTTTPRTGIRGNRKESRLTMNTIQLFEFLAQHAWAFWLLPPLLWLILRPWLRHRDRCRIDPAFARASRAIRRFRSHSVRDEETAWKTYLADRLGLHAEAVTFETVEHELKKQNISPELMQAVRKRFVKEDTTHYAPEGTPVDEAPSTRTLVQRIEKATKLTLLLLCLLPAVKSDAAPADDLFNQAMELRAERPDEALPLFTESALIFESEEQYLNAANSWFFAGEDGRALANYRSAESRNPADKQIRESIAFILSQRADYFQTSDQQTAKAAGIWKRFCRHSPALRFGLVTLLYVIGWLAFMTARIIGKTIRRNVWISYGAVIAILSFSLLWTALLPSQGVIIQASEARLGPGYAYEPAYDTILHESTEFQWLETRDDWVHARMPDKSEAWIRESACVEIK